MLAPPSEVAELGRIGLRSLLMPRITMPAFARLPSNQRTLPS